MCKKMYYARKDIRMGEATIFELTFNALLPTKHTDRLPQGTERPPTTYTLLGYCEVNWCEKY